MKHLGKRLLAAGLSAAMVLGSMGVVSATTVENGSGSGTQSDVNASDGWTMDNSKAVSLSGDFIITYYYTSTGGASTWLNAVVEINNGSGNDSGYSCIDAWGAATYAWAYNADDTIKGTASISYSGNTVVGTDGWLSAMQEGGECATTVIRKDNTFYISSTTAIGTDYQTTSVATVTYEQGFDGCDAYVYLGGESCTVTDITYEYQLYDFDDEVICVPWWSGFAGGIEIEEGSTYTISCTSTAIQSLGDNTLNYWSPSYVAYTSEDGAVNGENYSEYYVLRSDCYGWGTAGSYVATSYPSAWTDYTTEEEEGMNCILTASLSGTTLTLTSSAGGCVSTATITVDEENPVYLAVTGEQCILSDVSIDVASDAEDIVIFLGGSLKMSDDSDYSTTGLRFGYTIELPEGAELTSWSWNWGTEEENLTGSVTGANKVVDEETGAITTNLVITNIPSESYTTDIYSQLVVTYELNGVTYTVTDSVQSRTVEYVATAIQSSSTASTTEKTYAAGIIAAIE